MLTRLFARRPARARQAAPRRVRPRLEALEDRTALSLWTGFANHGATDMLNPANYNWGAGPVPGPHEGLEIPSICGQLLVCPFNALPSFTIDHGAGVSIGLSTDLHVGTLNISGGNTTTSSDARLFVDGSGVFDSGQISGGSSGGLVVENGAAFTVGEWAANEQTTLTTTVYVGTQPGLVTPSAASLTFAGSQTWVSPDFNLYDGNASSDTIGTALTSVTFAGDPNNHNSGTHVNAILPQGTASSGEISDFASMYVAVPTSPSDGVRTTVLNGQPVWVTGKGTLAVASRNALDITSSSALAFCVLDYGDMDLGGKNASDSADGNASVTCRGQGASVVGPSGGNTPAATLNVYGAGNTWSDVVDDPNDTRTLELSVSGSLKLGFSDSSLPRVRDSLDVAQGAFRFCDGANFVMTGRYPMTNGDSFNDFLQVDNADCIANGVTTVSPYVWGSPGPAGGWPVIQVNLAHKLDVTGGGFVMNPDPAFARWSVVGGPEGSSLWVNYSGS